MLFFQIFLSALLCAGVSLAAHLPAVAGSDASALRRHLSLAAREQRLQSSEDAAGPSGGDAVSPGTGMNGTWFYNWYMAAGVQATYTNGPDGQFSVVWTDAHDILGGKGWKTGTGRNISYTADYEPQGGSYLGAYGWSQQPLAEYYVLDSYWSASPARSPQFTLQGTVDSDGDTYDVYTTIQHNQPSVTGKPATFPQYFSIRRTKRTQGTVNMQNHFDAWTSFGMTTGNLAYQIIAVEGFGSSGNATVVVSG